MPEPLELDVDVVVDIEKDENQETWLDENDNDLSENDTHNDKAEYGEVRQPQASSTPRTPMRLFQMLRQKRETSYSPLRQYEDASGRSEMSDDPMFIQPLEILREEEDPHDWLFHTRSNPYFTLAVSSLLVQWPVLLLLTITTVQLLGRWWIASIFVFHAFVTVTGAGLLLRLYDSRHYYDGNNSQNQNNNNNSNTKKRRNIRLTLGTLLDLLLWGIFYPWIIGIIQHNMWTDYDGTLVPEYANLYRRASQIVYVGYAFLGLRILCLWILPVVLKPTNALGLGRCHVSFLQRIRTILQWGVTIETVVTVVIGGVCLLSAWSTLRPASSYHHSSHHPDEEAYCDYLDPTECLLPFPNYHYMNTNGKTVNLLPQHLPLRSGTLNTDVWNELDGFSTAGP